jgi:DNA-binding transcriptional MerR regulator
MSSQTASLAEVETFEAPKSAAPAKDSKKSASAFRTISEVADDLDVQQHVLRFWETKFSHIRPLKRGGGRRYYRPEDVALLKTIHNLLYTEGYTIKGVQKLLKEQGKNTIIQNNRPQQAVSPQAAPVAASAAASVSAVPATEQGLNAQQKEALEAVLEGLKELRALVDE